MRIRALLAAGLLVGAVSGLDAQERSVPDSVALTLLDRGKPPVRRATALVVERDSLERTLHALSNRGKPDVQVWPNLGAPKERGKAALWLFGGPTASDFPQLEQVACDQPEISGCSVDRFSFGPRLGVSWWPWWRRPFGFGLSGGRSRVSVTQRWEVTPFPERVVTELDVYTATAFFDAWHRIGRSTRIVGTIGYIWAWNRANITEYFAADTTFTTRRDDGGRWTIGASVERDISTKTRLRFEYRFIDGEAGDADRQHQFAILFGWVPGGRVPTVEPQPPRHSRIPPPPVLSPPPGEFPPNLLPRPPIMFPVAEPEVGGPPDRDIDWPPPPPPDGDGDGIPDTVDQCRDTPDSAIVDARGCAEGEGVPPGLDDDGDGEPNETDECTETAAGPVDARGCAEGEGDPPGLDDDGDGKTNDVDQCPNTPAGTVVDARGCGPGEPPTVNVDPERPRFPGPDDEPDGVTNDIDQCPRTPAFAEVDARGCAEGEGVPPGLDDDGDDETNDVDQCRNTPAGAIVDARGCGPGERPTFNIDPERPRFPGPDDEPDGITNDIDQCPRSPAFADVDGRGCAEGELPEITVPGHPSLPGLDDEPDGVPNDEDECQDTPPFSVVDARGCAEGEGDPPGLDDDGDGVLNEGDLCPGTPQGVEVDDVGCPVTRDSTEVVDPTERTDGDDDRDGVINAHDQCPDTRPGARVDERGCEMTTGDDDDGDGVLNEDDLCPGTPLGVEVDVVGCPGTGGEVTRALPPGTFSFPPGQPFIDREPFLAGRAHRVVFQVIRTVPDSVDLSAVAAGVEQWVQRTGGRDTIWVDADANRVADTLTARLTGPGGPGWTIRPDGPDTRAVDDETEWVWFVTPRCRPLSRISLSTRCQDELLTLHVHSHIEVDGGPPIAWQPTVEPIPVRVTRWTVIGRFTGLNWWWVWIFIAGPLGVARVIRDPKPPRPKPEPPFPPRGTDVVPRFDRDGEFEDVGDVLDSPEVINTSVPDAGHPSVESEGELLEESEEVVHSSIVDPGEPAVSRDEDLIDDEHVIVHRPVVDPGTPEISGEGNYVDEDHVSVRRTGAVPAEGEGTESTTDDSAVDEAESDEQRSSEEEPDAP